MRSTAAVRRWAFVACLAAARLVSACAAAAEDAPSTEAARAAYTAAAALQNREAWELAAEEWAALVAAHPHDPLALKARYYLGICQAKNDDWPAAAETLRAVLTTAADVETKSLARWELARGSFDQALRSPSREASAAAVATLRDFLAEDKGPAHKDEAILFLGESLWQSGQREQAIAAWERFVKEQAASPRLPEALYALGVGQIEMNRPAEALATFKRFADAFPTHALADDVAIWRADAALAAGDPAQAERALAPVAAGDGRRAIDALERLGAACWKQGRWAEAAAAYVDLSKKQPDPLQAAKALISAGRASLEAGMPDKARPLFERAMAAAGDTGADAAHRLVLVELDAGQPAKALAVADAFLAKPAAAAGGQRLLDVKAVRAEALLAQGDHASSAAAYRDLIKAHADAPQRGTWQLREAVALASAKQWQQVHDRLSTPRPQLRGDAAAEALLLDATALVELQQPKAAIPLLADIDKQHASWTRRDEALLLGVRARRESGDTKAALVLAETLVKEFPASRFADVAWYRLGQLRQDAGRHDDAIKAFEKAVTTKPDGGRAPWALLATGWCHEAAGRLADAIATWSRLIATHPDSAASDAAVLARGDAHYRQGDFPAGLADAERFLGSPRQREKITSATAEARMLAGLCLVGGKRYADAEKSFRRLLDEQPDSPAADRAAFEMGLAQSLGGRQDEAEKTLRMVVSRYPDSGRVADAWFEIGESRFAADRWDDAAAAYASAIQAAGTKQDAATLLEQARHKHGWAFAMKKDHAAAAKAFAEQVRLHPGGSLAADGQAMLGDSLFQSGDHAAAAAPLAAALADPAKLSSDDLRGLALIRAGECAALRRDWPKSLALAEQLIRSLPQSPSVPQARYAAAWAKQNMGRLDEAIAAYRTLADGGRTELAARARLMEGEVLFEEGRHKDAIKAFFKVAYGFGDQQAPAAFHAWQAQATYEAARCFEALGEREQAAKLYAELLDRHPDSAQTKAARQRLDALAPAATPPGKRPS
jgi:TolA-binding protein